MLSFILRRFLSAIPTLFIVTFVVYCALRCATMGGAYLTFEENDKVRVFRNEEFGYQRITVERPLRQRWEITDDTLALVADAKPDGKPDRITDAG